MPLDPRSRERLAALGRTLPTPLPSPEPPRAARPEATAPRHAVETEQNPEQLFRELMAASADGTVPSHLLDRLRQLESQRQRSQPAGIAARGASQAAAAATPSAPAAEAGSRRRSAPSRRAGRTPAPGSEEAELYTAFAQLLLEDDELD